MMIRGLLYLKRLLNWYLKMMGNITDYNETIDFFPRLFTGKLAISSDIVWRSYMRRRYYDDDTGCV